MHAPRIMIASMLLAASSLVAQAQDAAPPANPARPAGERPARAERAPGGGFGGPQLTPERAKIAWELQAVGVAKHLGLDETQTKSLVRAYADARASHEAASEKFRNEMAGRMREGRGGPGGGEGEGAPGGPGRTRPPAGEAGGPGGGGGAGGRRGGAMGEAMKAMEELNKAEREKFLKSLPASLSAAQSEKLMASLGTFNRQWDTAADMIAEFKLEPAKQQAALNAMEDFVVSSAKARGPAGAGPGDAEDARVAILEAREKLLDELKKTLNDEQFSKVETTLSQRGMRQGGRGGRPGGPDAPPPPPGRG